MIKKAMILAAGFGKRLNPLTLDCPKPLLKIGKETLLSNTINFLENYGTEEAVINVHYFSDQIIEYVNKKKFNLKITIVNEKEKILDTGGGILNALKYFKESFVCINPDTIWSLNYLEELNFQVVTNLNDEIIKKFSCLCIVQHHDVDKKRINEIYRNSLIPYIYDCQNKLQNIPSSKSTLESFG